MQISQADSSYSNNQPLSVSSQKKEGVKNSIHIHLYDLNMNKPLIAISAFVCLAFLSCGKLLNSPSSNIDGVWVQEELGLRSVMHFKRNHSYESFSQVKIPFAGEVIVYASGTWEIQDSLLTFSIVEEPIIATEKGVFDTRKFFSEFKLEGQHFEIGEKIVTIKKSKYLVFQEGNGSQSTWLPSDKVMLNRLKEKFEDWNN